MVPRRHGAAWLVRLLVVAHTSLVVAHRSLLLPRRPAMPRRRAPVSQCCICINCKFVDRCKTYHWVETMHEQAHLTTEPDFDPDDPQVQVFLRNEEEGTLQTTEYDVFACDAFQADEGKWLRLMPDADFIPT